MNDIEQRFQAITDFIEARLTPLFDPANGKDHGFGMDDTSRALRALRYTVQAASAVKGLVEKRESAPELRPVVDQALEHNWDVLRSAARMWEDHADFQKEFKAHSWDVIGV
ncbi:hypothetical protein [Streptomyces narbonensis]|uniref:hypothetical protein n=1 Tax=Streptomyces narbonensis TaxID=67333 RepID=UPI00167615BC|nr:hypothetical protein [Streptomyces narbonensis]GGV97913.1 hypothetical protein GCM10010230_19990 [Streptomyces narbonensis]